MTPDEFNTALNHGTLGHALFGVSGDADHFTGWCPNRELLTVGVFAVNVNQQVIDHVHHMTQGMEKSSEFEVAGTILVPRPYYNSDELDVVLYSLNFHDHVIIYGCEIDRQTSKLKIFA